jgi:hypothetical protein
MPTASVRPHLSDGRERTRARINAWVPIAVIASLIAIALLAPSIQPGPFVSRVTVVNNSAYAFDVDVAGAKADDWMLLEIATANASTSVGTVFDQGSTWTFRFTVQGRVLGTVVESRADLANAGWRVSVPAQYADVLRRDGVVPTA